jgi:glutathione peroxidase
MFLIFSFMLGFYSKAVAVDSIYQIQVTTIDGKVTDLSIYKGKVLLIVNTASKCGFTPQYEGLEKLYEKYRSKGLVILGFPSNDFGEQEPAPNEEIKKFCQLKYGVSFPLFVKGHVKGPEKQPLFAHLVAESADKSEIKWNFEKFLLGRDGKLVLRFSSKVKPDEKDMTSAIEKLL